MAAKEDVKIAKSLVVPLTLATVAIVVLALIGRAQTEK